MHLQHVRGTLRRVGPQAIDERRRRHVTIFAWRSNNTSSWRGLAPVSAIPAARSFSIASGPRIPKRTLHLPPTTEAYRDRTLPPVQINPQG